MRKSHRHVHFTFVFELTKVAWNWFNIFSLHICNILLLCMIRVDYCLEMSQLSADVWDGADWVMNVSDPALEFERINSLFNSLIFATVPEDDEELSGENADAPRRKLLSRK